MRQNQGKSGDKNEGENFMENLDICAKTNEAGSSKGKDEVTEENKILQQIFIAFLHIYVSEEKSFSAISP